MIAAPRPLRALVEAVHDALDVARLARTVRILSREKAALAMLAAEQEERADQAEADLDVARRERDEAVAALEHRDAGAEFRRASAN